MGTKVHIFIWSLLVYGLAFDQTNATATFFNLYTFVLIYTNFKIWQFTNKFPGFHYAKNFTSFLRTSALSFNNEINELWMRHDRDKFSTWIGFERFLTVSKMDDVKAVISETQDGPLFANYEQMWPWLGGDDIKSKDFSSQIFVECTVDGTFDKLRKSESFWKSVNDKVNVMCEKRISENEVQGALRKLFFEIIFDMALGDQTCQQRSSLFQAGEKLCEMSDQRMYCGWKQSKVLRKAFGEELKFENYRKVFSDVVQKVIDERRVNNIRNLSCLLDVLLTDGRLSQQEIVSTLTGFIVLGYDRLSSSTCLALNELAKRSDIQKIVRNEMKQNESSSLEKLILETQRLRPAVPLLSKWIPNGIPLVGFFIPTETSVFLYLNGMSRDASRFPLPENFDINRENLDEALVEKGKNLPLIVTSTVLQNLVSQYQMKVKNERDEVGCGITMRPIGCKIHLESY